MLSSLANSNAPSSNRRFMTSSSSSGFSWRLALQKDTTSTRVEYSYQISLKSCQPVQNYDTYRRRLLRSGLCSSKSIGHRGTPSKKCLSDKDHSHSNGSEPVTHPRRRS